MSRPRPGARRAAPAALAALGLAFGACLPDQPDLPELPKLYVGNVWGGNLAVAEGRAFFTTFYHGDEQDQAVWSVLSTGGPPGLLWHGAPDEAFGQGMALHKNRVFWAQADGDTPAVFSVANTGGERALHGRFSTAQAPTANLTVADDFIFAANGSEIIRIPRTGGDARVVYTGRVQWIERDGGPLYFVGDGVLVRLDPTTAAVTPVAQVAGASQVEVVGQTAWVAAGDAVWTVPLAGGLPARTLTGLGEVEGIVAGNGELFIAVHQDNQHAVLRYPLGGMPSPIFHTRAVEPSMVVAEGALFLAFCCEELDSTSGGQVVRLELQ